MRALATEALDGARRRRLNVAAYARLHTADINYASALAVAAAMAFLLVGMAYHEARDSTTQAHFLVFWLGYFAGFITFIVAGLRSWSGRYFHRTSLAGLGVFTFAPKFLMSVDRPSYFDEWGHWRHVNDILATHSVDPSDAFQPIIKYFPGLGVSTAIVHEITRLDTWHSGQLVILAAHTGALLAIYGICTSLGIQPRSAFVGALIFAANPNYLYFDSQYSYESLALPLALGAIYLTLRAVNADRHRLRWAAGALFFIAATTVTHHVVSIFMAVVLLLIVACNLRGKSWSGRLLAVAIGAAGLAAPALWLTVWASPAITYLKPRLSTISNQALQEVGLQKAPAAHAITVTAAGATHSPAVHGLFQGGGTPQYERLIALLAPLAITLVLAIALVKLYQAHRGKQMVPFIPFLLLAASYFALLPLNFLASASEVVHRSWPYSYVGIAVIGASVVDRMVATGSWLPRFKRVTTTMRHLSAVPVAVTLILVVGAGNVPAGTNVEYRFPGPYEFSSDSWGVDPAAISLAQWVDQNLPQTGIVTDRVTGEIITGYSQARVPDLYQGAVFGLYLHPDNPSEPLRQALLAGGFQYFILDTHVLTTLPQHSWFEGWRGTASLSLRRLAHIRSNLFIDPVHSQDGYIVYRISP